MNSADSIPPPADEGLRILQLEDSVDDAELEVLQLRRDGLTFTSLRVDTREAFLAALEDFKPHIVLADYKLPAFDGGTALALVRERHPEIPVIMVSGALGEEGAVELLRQGARDFVLKDRIARLGAAVRNALAENAERTRRRQAEQVLQESELRFRNLIESTSDIVAVARLDGTITYISPAIRDIGGYEPGELIGRSYFELVLSEDWPDARRHLAAMADRPGELLRFELRFRHKDGSVRQLESVVRNLAGTPGIEGIVVNMRDVTERKQAEAERLALLDRAGKQLDALARADASPALVAGDVAALARELTELAAHVSGAERANAWLFNDDETELHCIDLYEATPDRHSSGMVLRQSEFENEFRALKTAPFVDADDALTDPRTAGYIEGYLKPLRITSMLDTVIEAGGRHQGLLCIEHVDHAHRWTPDEIAFAGQLADRLSLCLVNRSRNELTRELQEAQRLAHIGNWRLEPATGAVTWSEEVYRIFGRDPAQPAPAFAEHQGLMTSASFQQLDAAIAACRRSGQSFDVDLEVLQPSGAHRWISARGAAIRDPDGTVVALRGTAQDITERRLAAHALSKAQKLTEAILDAIPVRVFWKDRNLVYLGCNAPFARDAGFSDPHELIGKDDFAMGWREQAERYRSDDRQVIESGNAKMLVEEPQTTPDGNTITLLTSKLPLRDARGEIIGVLGSYMDISDRKRSEERIQASEARLREAQRLAQLGSWALDLRTRSLVWSEEIYRIFEIDPARFDASYQSFLGAIHPDDRAAVDRAYSESIASRKPYSIEHRLLMPDGRIKFVHEEGQTFYGVDGAPLRSVGTVQDITERRLQEAVLRRTARALSALSRGNSALVHAQTEQQLYEDMCKAIVEAGGYRAAWVGLAEPGAGGAVRLAARAGISCACLDPEANPDDGGVCAAGLADVCVGKGEPQLCHDIATDPRMEYCRQAALDAGLKAALALPLKDADGIAYGALSIYTDDPQDFDAQELPLLTEMAGDLAYGIASLRARAAQRAADEQVRMLARFPAENPNAVMRLDRDGVLLYANAASAAVLAACDGRVGAEVPEPCRTLARGAFAAAAIREEEVAFGENVFSLTFAPVAEAGYVNVYGVDVTSRRQAEHRLHAALVATVESIAATMEMRDPYTAGHQRRVAALAAAIATELGLPAATVEGIHFGALLHDLGKIQIPAEILSKPAQLSRLEMQLIQTHPQAGYDIIRNIQFPWPVALMVLQHHERLDGSGYPQGLKGEQICPEARILAVADVVEAMSSHRPYRPGHGLDAALKEISDRKGVWLDAAAVDACLRLFRDKRFTMEGT